MTATSQITDERITEVLNKYEDLIRRQPNYRGYGGPASLLDENGDYTDVACISIIVTENVDRREMAVEDRIPDCLEGVPVQIIRGAPMSFSEEVDDLN